MTQPPGAPPAPRLSVVVAATDAHPDPTRALRSLAAQTLAVETEVLVVTHSGEGTRHDTENLGIACRRLELAAANLPRLKEAGIRAAEAEIVAILDPSAEAAPNWVEEILAAFEDPDIGAVGGAVLLVGEGAATARAIYLFEYGAFNPPLEAGDTGGDLPGNNVAYRRSLLVEDCRDILDEEGFNKPFCHQRLRRRGARLEIRPAMRVLQEPPARFVAVARSRFHYGRCFGATRRRRSPWHFKLLYVLGSPVVPLLLTGRALRRSRAHPVNRTLLSGAVAALTAICLSWGFGEWLGTWSGSRASCRELR